MVIYYTFCHVVVILPLLGHHLEISRTNRLFKITVIIILVMKTGGKLNNMKVIFLDFNGVLDTQLCMDEINEDNLKRLQHIVNETGAKVVISSSLKNHYYELGYFLQYYLDLIEEIKNAGIEVIGITPHENTREEEIQEYLKQHPEVENYCIIDDDYDMESMKDHMVKLPTQMEKGQMGLDDFHMDLAIDILKKK